MCDEQWCNCHRTKTNDTHIYIDPRTAALPLVPPRHDYLARLISPPIEDRE
jgi:hypothetical protein